MEPQGRFSLAVFAFTLVFAGDECFHWTDSFEDSAFLAACAHGNVTLPWTFSLSSGETVEDIKWNFRSKDGQQELVASFVSGTFLPAPSFSQRVEFLDNGGLMVEHLSKGDTGNYTVEVAVHQPPSTYRKYTKSAFVEVADGLHVREEADPVYDPKTNSWHVALSCGTVVNTDGSTDHIMWLTPTGVLESSRYEDGHFFLHLENPIMGGNYSCSLHPYSSASVCMPGHSQQQATIVVDESKLRVSLLEAENKQVRSELSQVKADNADLRSLMEDLINTTKFIQERSALPVSFHARFYSSDNTTYANNYTAIKLSHVLLNQGYAYDDYSGFFYAPSNGTYFFSATAGSVGYNYVGLHLMVDDEEFCFTQNGRRYYEVNGSSCSATVQLAEGQRVWLRSACATDGYRCVFNWESTVFTGFMVNTEY